MSFAKSFSFSFQIFPSKWELSCGHVAVVKAFVSISILWLLSSLRFSVPHGTGSILSMCFVFGIRKLWSNLLKVTQLVRSKVGLRPASSPPAWRFPALLITMVAASAGGSGSQVMPVDCGSWFLRGMSSELDEKRWGWVKGALPLFYFQPRNPTNQVSHLFSCFLSSLCCGSQMRGWQLQTARVKSHRGGDLVPSLKLVRRKAHQGDVF